MERYLKRNNIFVTRNGKLLKRISEALYILIKSFGANTKGQLLMGTTSSSSPVFQTPNITNIKYIQTNINNSFIVFGDGTIQSVGDNTYGQLALNNETNYGAAIQTPSFSNVKTISGEGYTTFILFNDGTVKSIGQNTWYGSMGMGNKLDYNGIVQTLPFVDVKSIHTSKMSTFILFNDGTVKSFGQTTSGKLGMGNTTSGNDGSVQTPSFSNVKTITNGYCDHIFVLFNDGTVKSFGNNQHGELGMGDKLEKNGIIQTPPFENVKEVAVGYYHTVLLFNDGTIKTFGLANSGQLGMGDLTSGEDGSVQSPPFTNVKHIYVGGYHTYLEMDDGTVKTFGLNNNGMLGMGNSVDYSGAVQTPDLGNFSDLYIGDSTNFIMYE